MIRAAFDVHVIGQRATGNETYAEGLLRAFESEMPADMELLLYHSRRDVPGIARERRRHVWPEWPYVRIPVTTPLFLARDRVDVAHFQYFAPPLCPCPTVITVHDLSFERHPEYFAPAMAARMRALMPWMARRATRLVAVSEATRDDLVELYRVDPGKVDVIYNGISPEFGPVADRGRAMRSLARFALGEGPFIVCVGNIGRRKNQVRVVRAFARLVREKGLPHTLVLVGKQESPNAFAEAGAEDLDGRVRRVGFVTREELVALYALSDFSVYASLYEGFGLPIVESMACGTPVLTSHASCMPEIAGEAALYADPEDEASLLEGMERLAGDEALRRRLAAAGLERCRRFTWAEAARLTLESYRRAAGG